MGESDLANYIAGRVQTLGELGVHYLRPQTSKSAKHEQEQNNILPYYSCSTPWWSWTSSSSRTNLLQTIFVALILCGEPAVFCIGLEKNISSVDWYQNQWKKSGASCRFSTPNLTNFYIVNLLLWWDFQTGSTLPRKLGWTSRLPFGKKWSRVFPARRLYLFS